MACLDNMLERSLTEMDWLLQLNGFGTDDNESEATCNANGTEQECGVNWYNGVFGCPSKPQCSYTQLIASAIGSSPRKRMVLSEIYDWIQDNHPYYKTASPGWKVYKSVN